MFCKDCLFLWYRQHHTCPICKTHLKATSFHEIVYKPQALIAHEEKHAPRRHSKNAIYENVSSGVLSQIQTIKLDGSYGTKIDTISRHLIWLRQHDPGAKAIVFSQYRDFLKVLQAAFSRFKIGCSNIDDKNGIENFKNDPAVC